MKEIRWWHVAGVMFLGWLLSATALYFCLSALYDFAKYQGWVR